MAKILLKNKKTNEEEKASLGFSILVLLFGPLKCLYDREYPLGFGIGIVSYILRKVILDVTSRGMLTEIEEIIYEIFFICIVCLAPACFYNKYHVERLIKKGYRLVDEKEEILLKKYGIEYKVLVDSVEKEALPKDTVEEGILLKNEENNS